MADAEPAPPAESAAPPPAEPAPSEPVEVEVPPPATEEAEPAPTPAPPPTPARPAPAPAAPAEPAASYQPPRPGMPGGPAPPGGNKKQGFAGGSAHFAKLVGMVNKLQAVCAVMGDNAESNEGGGDMPGLWDTLPIIVAIGGQSAGKSSVIEAIVGMEFLPRGSGICTRRPLVLQMMQCEEREGETATFLHKKGKVYDVSKTADFVREEIEGETSRSLGVGKAVSAEPIMLTVKSPYVPNLTLVDMPGLTKIATDGQPQSIVRELEDMSKAYIKSENVIILAVSPANADIATSDAMRLVKEYDPDGERTIGVLTKLDLMDKGTDARAVLSNADVYLKHGWIGVVNRSQQDINKKVSSGVARERERQYFKDTKVYHGLTTGTDSLVNNLTTQLEGCITKALPKIQQHIDGTLRTMEKELATFAEMPPDRASKMAVVLELLATFERAYGLLIEGGKGGGRAGSTLRNLLERNLPTAIYQLPFSQTYSLRSVKEAIEVADGVQSYLIAPEKSMRRLISDGVAMLRPPAVHIVEAVHSTLSGMVEQAMDNVVKSNPDLGRYAFLRQTIQRTALSMLEKYKGDSMNIVTTLVDMEAAYFTASFFRDAQAQSTGRALAAKHGWNAVIPGLPQFEGQPEYAQSPGPGASPVPPGLPGYNPQLPAYVPPAQRYEESEFTPEVEAQLARISSTVTAYVATLADALLKNIPKAVVHVQVQQTKTSLLKPLYAKIGGITDEQLRQLLGDEPEVAKRREVLSSRVSLLRKASEDIKAEQF